jgi:hypothetical protein
VASVETSGAVRHTPKHRWHKEQLGKTTGDGGFCFEENTPMFAEAAEHGAQRLIVDFDVVEDHAFVAPPGEDAFQET